MLIPGPAIKTETVSCPECATPMTLARVTPRLGGMAELHSFECKQCHAVLTQVVDECSREAGVRGYSRRDAI